MRVTSHLLYAMSKDRGNIRSPFSYTSIARMKNLKDLAASPARHFSPASSKSTPAARELARYRLKVTSSGVILIPARKSLAVSLSGACTYSINNHEPTHALCQLRTSAFFLPVCFLAFSHCLCLGIILRIVYSERSVNHSIKSQWLGFKMYLLVISLSPSYVLTVYDMAHIACCSFSKHVRF